RHLRSVSVCALDVQRARDGGDQPSASPASCLPAAGNPPDLNHRLSGRSGDRDGAAGGCELKPLGTIADTQSRGARQRNLTTGSGIERRTGLPDVAATEPAEAQGNEGDCRSDRAERRGERELARAEAGLGKRAKLAPSIAYAPLGQARWSRRAGPDSRRAGFRRAKDVVQDVVQDDNHEEAREWIDFIYSRARPAMS